MHGIYLELKLGGWMRTAVLDPVFKNLCDSLPMTGFLLPKAESKTASWFKSTYEKCFS